MANSEHLIILKLGVKARKVEKKNSIMRRTCLVVFLKDIICLKKHCWNLESHESSLLFFDNRLFEKYVKKLNINKEKISMLIE